MPRARSPPIRRASPARYQYMSSAYRAALIVSGSASGSGPS